MPRNYYSCLGCRRGEEKGTNDIQGELMGLNHCLNLGRYERGGIKDSFEDLSLSYQEFWCSEEKLWSRKGKLI